MPTFFLILGLLLYFFNDFDSVYLLAAIFFAIAFHAVPIRS